MKNLYDVLIIGAGPGGALAARTAAEKGLSVCMIEKRPAIGTPVRCAEGVSKELLAQFVEVDPKWISTEIRGAKIVSPDGSEMYLNSEIAGNEVGYVLDRKMFDRELVWQAANAGAEVYVKTRAVDAIVENGIVCGANIETGGKIHEVRASVVIAADGVESKFARWCGVDTTVPVRELETCAQYLMTGIDIDPHTTVFYIGNEVSPEGYVWVFPKGDGTANVGMGMSGRKSGDGHRPIDYINKFVAEKFPDGKTIELIIGGVSVCRPLECTVADGLIIIGDAARVSDPITGGGIYNAMYTGSLAAEVAAECIAKKNCTKSALMRYDQEWRASRMGKALERNYIIKEIFVNMSDEKLNSILDSVSSINLQEFSTLTLIKELLKHNPRLLMDLAPLKKLFR